MGIKQAGVVINVPEIINNKAIYEISIDGKRFTAESVGNQAIKDYLFIRKGQNVEIEGDISDKHIEVQQAKIDISGMINTQ